MISGKQVKEMQDKFRDALDPNKSYSQEDFMVEYNNMDKFEVSNPEYHKLQVNFVNKSDNEDPTYQTEGSAGFDLRANLSEPITIKSGEVQIVPTGLFFELLPNTEMQVRPRSGLAAKHGITVLNSPGTVDSDYRGEVKVILINHGKNDFVIEHGERIAQAVIASVVTKNAINLKRVDSISEDTDRGTGGFGSTGTK